MQNHPLLDLNRATVESFNSFQNNNLDHQLPYHYNQAEQTNNKLLIKGGPLSIHSLNSGI